MPNIKFKEEFEKRFVDYERRWNILGVMPKAIWSFIETALKEQEEEANNQGYASGLRDGHATALATQQKEIEKKIERMRIKHKKLRPYNAYEDVHNATLDDILALMRKVK